MQYKDSLKPDSHGSIVLTEFFFWLRRSQWIAGKQVSKPTIRKFRAIYHSTVQYFLAQMPFWFREHLTQYEWFTKLDRFKSAVKAIDISIVIPCANAKENVLAVLERIVEWGQQQAPGGYEIIVVADNSTDGTLEAAQKMRDEHESIFVIAGSGQGAGRARNAAIPLIEGRYAYFLDADDDLNLDNLWEAVSSAKALDTELMFVPYNLSMPPFRGSDEGGGEILPMMPADEKIWNIALKSQQSANSAVQDLKKRAYPLINYPWNRIIKTQVLRSKDIFFGPTPVHNDVQFHWHTVTAAKTVAFFDKPVCIHRKAPGMKQITNIATRDRIEAIRMTDRVLLHNFFFDQDEGIKELWAKFKKIFLAAGAAVEK